MMTELEIQGISPGFRTLANKPRPIPRRLKWVLLAGNPLAQLGWAALLFVVVYQFKVLSMIDFSDWKDRSDYQWVPCRVIHATDTTDRFVSRFFQSVRVLYRDASSELAVAEGFAEYKRYRMGDSIYVAVSPDGYDTYIPGSRGNVLTTRELQHLGWAWIGLLLLAVQYPFGRRKYRLLRDGSISVAELMAREKRAIGVTPGIQVSRAVLYDTLYRYQDGGGEWHELKSTLDPDGKRKPAERTVIFYDPARPARERLMLPQLRMGIGITPEGLLAERQPDYLKLRLALPALTLACWTFYGCYLLAQWLF